MLRIWQWQEICKEDISQREGGKIQLRFILYDKTRDEITLLTKSRGSALDILLLVHLKIYFITIPKGWVIRQ
jgi:hypothetical protein